MTINSLSALTKKEFQAQTIEDALLKAADELSISVSELDYKIISYPTKGFFGIGAKKAIIEARLPTNKISNIDEIIKDIYTKLENLLRFTGFQISKIDIIKCNKNIILIVINGQDAGLLIGKSGFRYKSLLYMLSQWIYPKYGLFVKLNIGDRFYNKQEKISKELQETIIDIEQKGQAESKTFDQESIYIALDILQKKFPHKNISTKSNDDKNYILVE